MWRGYGCGTGDKDLPGVSAGIPPPWFTTPGALSTGGASVAGSQEGMNKIRPLLAKKHSLKP